MSVRYRALALSDLDEMSRYLESRSPTGARSVLRAIHAAIEQIERYPGSAIETSIPGIRVRIIGRYRYKIFYSLAHDGAVEIIHIRHTARRPWRGLAR